MRFPSSSFSRVKSILQRRCACVFGGVGHGSTWRAVHRRLLLSVLPSQLRSVVVCPLVMRIRLFSFLAQSSRKMMLKSIICRSRARAAAGFLPNAALYSSSLLSSSNFTTMAQEAGRQASALAAKTRKGSHNQHGMDTVLAHAGVFDHTHPNYNDDASQYHNIPMSPPLHMATTYTRPADGEYLETDSIYSREDNPTRLLLEQEIARLEGHGLFASADGQQPRTVSFSSGMQAVSALILAHQAPLTVLLPLDLYHGTSTVLHEVFTNFGVTIQRVDWRDIDNIKTVDIPDDHALVVWMETPSNPLCHVIDIDAVCTWTRDNFEQPTTIVVDSTLAPPTIQQPLQYGVDVVMHSATKYFAGHSDALLGTLTTNPTTVQGQYLTTRLPAVQVMTGGVASTMDSWLCLRGLRTLAVRVRQQCQSAQQVAEYLQAHDSVVAVHYPGLPSHPQHAVAARQMKRFGGVLSLDMGTQVRAVALAAALQTIQRATSLGGTETLIEHRASIEPAGRVTSPPGLLRLSVGLEDTNDLLEDLGQALEIVEQVCSSS